MIDLLGKTIGQYQLIELIHQGDNTVYKAFQPAMNRYVAVKILMPSLTENQGFVRWFRQDMRFITTLEHPNILPIYDYGRQDDILYIVTRYIEGGSLLNQMSRYHSPEQAWQLIAPLAGALELLHSQGVIHGNLKPSNILIDPEGQPLLADIGFSQGIDISGGDKLYLSPEQIQGKVADHRTDVFALGVLLYHLLVGKAPFFGSLPSPRIERPDLPVEIEKVILKAMAQDPGQRFQSVAEFRDALNMALTDQAAPPPTEQTLQRFIWVAGGLAVALIAVLAILFFIVLGDGNTDSGDNLVIVIPTAAPSVPSITATADADIRTGPGLEYDKIGVLQRGQTAEATGRSPDQRWWVINLPPVPDGRGWVLAEQVQASNAENLPVIQPPPPPVPEPAQPPIAAINGPTQAQANQILTFSAGNSRAAEGSRIIEYIWDFDDGITATGVEVDHAYDSPGTYEVELTVTDDMDLNDSTVLQVRVDEEPATPEPEQPPVAVIEAPAETRVGQTVTFNGLSSRCANECRGYAWDLGDGTTANAVSIQHVYQSAGDFNVVLTVTDDQDLQSSANHQIAVIPSPPELPIPVVTINPTTAKVNETITLDGSQSQPGSGGNIISYAWDFDDGNTNNGAIVTHIYQDPGTYQVTLTVTDQDDFENSSEPTTIVISEAEEPEPTPTIPALPEPVINHPVEGKVGEPVTFDGSESRPGDGGDIVSYEWDFGDGNSGSGDVVSHIYDNPGTYRVTLTITDEDGFGNVGDPVEITIRAAE